MKFVVIFTLLYIVTACNKEGNLTFSNINLNETGSKVPDLEFSYTNETNGEVGKGLFIHPTKLNTNGKEIVDCKISSLLPTGLSIDKKTCVISGVPSVVLPSTTYSVWAINSVGTSNVATFKIKIEAPFFEITSPNNGLGISVKVSDQLILSGICNSLSTNLVALRGSLLNQCGTLGTWSLKTDDLIEGDNPFTISLRNFDGTSSAKIFNIFFNPKSTDGCDCESNVEPCSSNEIVKEFKHIFPQRPLSKNSKYTWKFNSSGNKAYCGKFANGDYWIAPKKGETVELESIEGNGLSISAELNPSDAKLTGILGAANRYGNYSAEKNLINHLPVKINKNGNNLVVAAIQRDEANTSFCGTSAIKGACVDSYQFLTILSEVPEDLGREMLRPSISVNGLKKLYKLSDFNFDRLELRTEFSKKSLETFENIRNRWQGTFEMFREYSEGGRAFRAHILVDDYASGLSASWNNDVTAILSSENSISEKKSALASMLTYGKDNYYIFHESSGPKVPWGSGAGQSAGRIPPVLLFVTLLKNAIPAESMSALFNQMTGKPQEFQQLNKTQFGVFWGDPAPEGEKRYWSELFSAQCYNGATGICLGNLGKKTSQDPYGYIDGPAELPGTYYFGISLGTSLSVATQMWIMPMMCDIVDNNNIIDFYERVERDGIAVKNDPCAPPDPRENLNCAPFFEGTTKPTNCSYYKVTWGPDPLMPGSCIKNNSGGNMLQTGRFSNRNTEYEIGYYVPDFLKNYQKFKNNRSNCRLHSKESRIIPSEAILSNTSRKLKWSSPSKWSDGSSFKNTELSSYKITYTDISTNEIKVIKQEELTYEFDSKVDLRSVSLDVCDYLNRCVTNPISRTNDPI